MRRYGIAIIALFLIVGIFLSVTSNKVSMVFSTIDSGLNPRGSSNRSSSSSWSPESAPTMRPPMTVAPAAVEAPAEAEAPALPDLPQSDTPVRYESNQPQQQQRLVIRNAQLALVVDDVPAKERRIRFQVESLGGFIVQSNVTNGANQYSKSRAEIVLRIPAQQFDSFINFVLDGAIEVLQNQVSGTDVTDAYVDLQSRLRSLEATYSRVLQFLDDAQTVEQALEVNRQLTEIQNEIEEVKGRMEYYKESAALSSIAIALEDNPEPEPTAIPTPTPTPTPTPIPDEGWKPGEVAGNSFGRLVNFSQGLANILIELLIWSPVWGFMLAVIFFMYRWFQKHES
jgi:hypothetical protein